MDEKLVSIIIPCYNAEGYIVGALDSIFNQDYSNIEVLCINDGSTDKTAEVITEYAKKRNKVHMIVKENGGVSSARNVGLDNAMGEYILFLDADDQFGTDCIRTLVDAVEKNNVDTAFGYWTINKDDMGLKVKKTDSKLNKLETVHAFMYKQKPNSFFSFIYIRNIIEKHNIRFDTDIKYGEDNLFFWKYVCYISGAVFVDQPLYWYYQNEQSAMHNLNWRFVDTAISINRASNYIEENFALVSNEFNSYMIPRTYFSIAMQFAKHRQKDFYIKFCRDYKVKENANKLINKNGLILSICSLILWASPNMFYWLCRFM